MVMSNISQSNKTSCGIPLGANTRCTVFKAFTQYESFMCFYTTTLRSLKKISGQGQGQGQGCFRPLRYPFPKLYS